MVAVVSGDKKDIVLKNVGGRAVGDLAQMGFVDREDFKILLNNKCLTKSEDKWFLVIHENIIDKVKVKKVILRYIH